MKERRDTNNQSRPNPRVCFVAGWVFHAESLAREEIENA
jgi:hypothetical protein